MLRVRTSLQLPAWVSAALFFLELVVLDPVGVTDATASTFNHIRDVNPIHNACNMVNHRCGPTKVHVCLETSPDRQVTLCTSLQGHIFRSPTSYRYKCGKCSHDTPLKCFDSHDELQAAVDEYYTLAYEPPVGYAHSHNLRSSLTTVQAVLTKLYGWPMNAWCVDQVQEFSGLFAHKSRFNEPLDRWHMDQATDTSGMFDSAYTFDQDLSLWDVSKVTNMSRMFRHAWKFSHSLRSWNVTSVDDDTDMFENAMEFNATALSPFAQCGSDELQLDSNIPSIGPVVPQPGEKEEEQEDTFINEEDRSLPVDYPSQLELDGNNNAGFLLRVLDTS